MSSRRWQTDRPASTSYYLRAAGFRRIPDQPRCAASTRWPALSASRERPFNAQPCTKSATSSLFCLVSGSRYTPIGWLWDFRRPSRHWSAAGEIDACDDHPDGKPIDGGGPLAERWDGHQRRDDRRERDKGGGIRCAQQHDRAAVECKGDHCRHHALIEGLIHELRKPHVEEPVVDKGQVQGKINEQRDDGGDGGRMQAVEARAPYHHRVAGPQAGSRQEQQVADALAPAKARDTETADHQATKSHQNKAGLPDRHEPFLER